VPNDVPSSQLVNFKRQRQPTDQISVCRGPFVASLIVEAPIAHKLCRLFRTLV
jgi:hypothetical protein